MFSELDEILGGGGDVPDCRSGRNSRVHSRPVPVSVCLSEGAGAAVLDSSEGSVTARGMHASKADSKVKVENVLTQNLQKLLHFPY